MTVASNVNLGARLLFFTVPNGEVLTIGRGTIIGANTLRTFQDTTFNGITTAERNISFGENTFWVRFVSTAISVQDGQGYILKVYEGT